MRSLRPALLLPTLVISIRNHFASREIPAIRWRTADIFDVAAQILHCQINLTANSTFLKSRKLYVRNLSKLLIL